METMRQVGAIRIRQAYLGFHLESDAEKRLKMLYDAETILLEEYYRSIYFYTQLPVGYESERMESEILGQYPFKYVYFEN